MRRRRWSIEPVPEARARFSWLAKRRFRSGQTHGRLLGRRRRRRGLLPASRRLPRPRRPIASPRPRRWSSLPQHRNRYALRGVMHAGVVAGCSACARSVSMATASRSGGTAMQPDVSFVIAAFNARGVARARHPKRARPARRERSRWSSSTIVRATARSRSRAAFPATRVRVVALERNRGPGGARNAGLEVGARPLDRRARFRRHGLSRSHRPHDPARPRAPDAEIVVDNLDVVQETTDRRETMFSRDAARRRFPRSGWPISSPPI